MSKPSTYKINGVDYTLQGASPRWVMEQSDKYGVGTPRVDTAGYIDVMLRNCVINPPAVRQRGLDFFDEIGDLSTPEKLIAQIERYLREPVQFEKGPGPG